jgi:arsenical pump membrane protein
MLDAPVLALALLLLTLAGVMARPRGIAEWITAVVGAVAMIVVGALTPAEALAAVLDQWNVLLFFLGLMTTAAVAEQSGVLAWLTGGAYTLARGRDDLLLVLVSVLCVFVTATLSNDATILLLTPLVVRMVSAAGGPVLPYALACALLANAASALLPIANPTNIIVLQAHPLVLSEFLRYLFLPSLAAIIATIVTLLVQHRVALRGRFRERRHAPRPRPPDAALFAAALGATLAMYLAALQLHLPIGPVSVVGGSVLLLALLVRRRFQPRSFLHEIEWGVFPFFAALVVVVAGAARAGLVDAAAAVIRELGSHDQGPVFLGVAAALLANGMNNLPAAVLTSAGLARAGDVADPHLVTAGLLIGIDVGPSFTTLGSMATLMWVMILRRRGVAMSSLGYLRWSVVPSLLALAAALIVLTVVR